MMDDDGWNQKLPHSTILSVAKLKFDVSSVIHTSSSSIGLSGFAA
jgi:hypothetical protein